jgi:oligosaccharide repeat unit polymerase
MGQSVLRLFNIEHNFTDIYKFVDLDAMVSAHAFTILCIAFLFEGALIAVQSKEKKYKYEQYKQISYDSPLFGQVGLLLFIVSCVPMLIYLTSLVTAYKVGGYAYAFDSVSESSGIMRIISKIYPFCTPSLVMMIIGYSDDKRKIAQFVMFGIGVIYFFIGERTGAASVFLALFILSAQLNEENDISNKIIDKMKIVILICILAIFIPAVGTLRNSSDLSIISLTSTVQKNGILSGFIDTIATMGYSEFPLGKTIEIVPNSKGYAYGQSYLFAIFAIFPNIFGGTHISVKYAGLAQWLMDYLNMSYGPGYSYPAEAWYNFGWFGCVMLLLIGYFFARCMYIPKGVKVSNVSLFISTTFFLETITSPRRELMTVVRLVGYYVFIPIIVMYFLDRRKNLKYINASAKNDK